MEIPLAILVPGNVTAGFSRFGKMVGIFLLAKAKSLPSRHFETHYLYVGEFVNDGLHDVKIVNIQELFLNL